MTKRLLIALCLFSCVGAFALPKMTKHPVVSNVSIGDLKMRKRFGVGVSGGGSLAMLGIEFDVNLSEEISLSGGIGTGLQYNTSMLKLRYYLLGEWVSPYLALGVARWWSNGTRAADIGPSVLTNKFLGPDVDPRHGFDVVMLTPAMGVQFMHPMGIAVFAEVYYLFRLVNFANGTYAGMGMHWYF